MVCVLCFSGGREIWVHGQNLDVVQMPRIRVTVALRALPPVQRRRRVVPEAGCSPGPSCGRQHVSHLGPPHLLEAAPRPLSQPHLQLLQWLLTPLHGPLPTKLLT